MELPAAVPVMTLPSATLFPQALLPLYIFEPRYRQMLADTLLSHRMFSVAMQRPGRSRENPCSVAGLGLIRVSVNHADGTSHLVLQGLTRVELGDPVHIQPYRVHSIRPLKADPSDNVVIDALVAKVHELVEIRMKQAPFPFPFPALKGSAQKKLKIPQSALTVKEIVRYLQELPSADLVADLVSCALLSNAQQRQAILETVEIEVRLKRLVRFLLAEIRRSTDTSNT